MFLKSILAVLDPIAHWTGENYSPGATGNVYNEYGSDVLLNQNATLGADGELNTNYSSKSFNLKGGHLIVADGTYLADELASKDFSIHFQFKTGSTISSTRPLISKWSPEQVFWIGFEDGTIKLKVMTDGGLIVGTPTTDVIVSEFLFSNRWNMVNFRATSTALYLYVNGVEVIELITTSPLETSSISALTVGSPSPDAFTEDVYINDIAITATDTVYNHLALYKMPRSDREVWMDFNPEYLFFCADQAAIDINAPIANSGTVEDVYGYFMSDLGETPTLYTHNTDDSRPVVNIGVSSWFTIDDEITFHPDSDGGFTFMYDGSMATGSHAGTSSNHYHYKYMEIKASETSLNGEFILSDERGSSTYHWLGHRFRDGSASILHTNERLDGSSNRASYFDAGGGVRKFTITPTQLQASTAQWPYYSNNQTVTDTFEDTYSWSEAFAYNKFLWQGGETSYTYSRPRTIMFCDRAIHITQMNVVSYQRLTLFKHMITNLGDNIAMLFTGWINNTLQGMRDWTSGMTYSEGMSACRGGYVFEYGNVDGLANRQNEIIASTSLTSTASWYGQNALEDNNYVDSNDFTVNVFIRNMNTTSRYEILGLALNQGNCLVDKGTPKFTMWMNSRDGAFSLGDVEWGWNNASGSENDYAHSTTSQKFGNTGFHMLTFMREGTINRLYIDAQIDTQHITPTIYACGTTNTAWRLYGGPCYINDFIYFRYNPISIAKMEFLFKGFSDIVKGQTLLDGDPLESRLLAIQHETGKLIQTDSSDATTGEFVFQIPKDVQHRGLDIVALPVDGNDTNHVVVHGPYNANTNYSRYVDEVFESSLADMIIDFGPTHFYKLDDAGSTAVDSSGNSADATYSGTMTKQQPGPNPEIYSAAFDRTGSGHVIMPTVNENYTAGFTFEAWVLFDGPNDSNSAYERVFSMSDSLNGGNFIALARTNGLQTMYGVSAGWSSYPITTISVIFTGMWRHYVYRVLPDNTQEIWVDGGLVETDDTGAAIGTFARNLAYIGKSIWTSNAFFDGNISHAAFYNYPLPAEEIKKHHVRGKGYNIQTLRSTILYDAPIFYWTFDRLIGLVDEIEANTFTATGTYAIEKNALVLNGGSVGNNYLTATGANVVAGSADDWTVELSVKIPDGTQTDAIIVGEWDQSIPSGTWKLEIDTADTFKVFFGTEATYLESSTIYDDNAWHHIVIVYDGDVLWLYVDGTAEDSVSVAISNYDIHSLVVGNDETGIGTHFLEDAGHIDDLAIYDRALNTGRIDEHYALFQDKKGSI